MATLSNPFEYEGALDAFGCGCCFTVVCCTPCLYGNGWEKSNATSPLGLAATNTNPLRPSGGCMLFACLTCLGIGHVAACVTGTLIRISEPHNQGFPGACVAESCPLCSCAGAQMYNYVKGPNQTAKRRGVDNSGLLNARVNY